MPRNKAVPRENKSLRVKYDKEACVEFCRQEMLKGSSVNSIKMRLYKEFGCPLTALGTTWVVGEARQRIRDEYNDYKDLARELHFRKLMDIYNNSQFDSTRLKALDALSRLFQMDVTKVEVKSDEYILDLFGNGGDKKDEDNKDKH